MTPLPTSTSTSTSTSTTTTTTTTVRSPVLRGNPDELRQHLQSFFAAVGRQEIEIYNEFSLQHEFGLFLRTKTSDGAVKIQFERPAAFFGITNKLTKKEIDLACFRSPEKPLAAVEFKFPRAKQVPIRMFKYCQDEAFLEELVLKERRFERGYAVMAADNRDFYQGNRHAPDTIYSAFRNGTPLRGTINKPTGTYEPPVTLMREYKIEWQDVGGLPNLRYTMTIIAP
jgi:hypothetical protein